MPVSTAPVGTNLRSSQRCCPWIQVLEVWWVPGVAWDGKLLGDQRVLLWAGKAPVKMRIFHHNMEQASVPRWICLSVGPRAAGIGILTVILGILLFIGCWYCRRRSGYRSLKVGKVPTAGILPDPGFCFLLFLCISEEWGNFLKITSSSDFWF